MTGSHFRRGFRGRRGRRRFEFLLRWFAGKEKPQRGQFHKKEQEKFHNAPGQSHDAAPENKSKENCRALTQCNYAIAGLFARGFPRFQQKGRRWVFLQNLYFLGGLEEFGEGRSAIAFVNIRGNLDILFNHGRDGLFAIVNGFQNLWFYNCIGPIGCLTKRGVDVVLQVWRNLFVISSHHVVIVGGNGGPVLVEFFVNDAARIFETIRNVDTGFPFRHIVNLSGLVRGVLGHRGTGVIEINSDVGHVAIRSLSMKSSPVSNFRNGFFQR
mmetsp:Transcript_7065/g.14574  ORF Transcript_7065/g.14574 Transcript_7065/m.14574 type:complete len:269 (-) Transcript_7065:756-1562(-)